MGRTKTYDREEILERAMQAFWRTGYEATSTADLVEAMGVNRFSVYAEFETKHELYQAALDRYLDREVPRFIWEMLQPDAGLKAIVTVLDRFASAAGNPGAERGCMVCNAATETSAHDTQTREKVQRYIKTIEKAFVECLRNAIRAKQLDPHLNMRRWSRKLTTSLVGVFVLIRSRVDGAIARDACRMIANELRAHKAS